MSPCKLWELVSIHSFFQRKNKDYKSYYPRDIKYKIIIKKWEPYLTSGTILLIKNTPIKA